MASRADFPNRKSLHGCKEFDRHTDFFTMRYDVTPDVGVMLCTASH